MFMPLLFKRQTTRQKEHLAGDQREFLGLYREQVDVEDECRKRIN